MDIDKTCFVISPIGAPDSENRKHADQVFKYIIEPGLKEFDIDPVRSDQINETGMISDQMMEYIFKSKLCIVVLTGENPNVYYELAVAQCAGRPVVLLIMKGEIPRFDVQDLRTIEYDLKDPDRLMAQIDAKAVSDFIRTYINNDWEAESLFDLYPEGPKLFTEKEMRLKAETLKPKALNFGEDKAYRISNNSDAVIQILTGSVEYVSNIDVIVNSENVELQLARYYDRSLSGILRYLDAEKNPGGKIIRDHLNEEMAKVIESIGSIPVMPGTVVETETNGLKKNKIKYIFHLALAIGEIGAGYENVEGRLEKGIRAVFDLFRKKSKEEELISILFPLIGAGSTQREPNQAALEMMSIITQEMQKKGSPKKLYLQAWRESHMLAYRNAASKLKLIEIE